MRVQDAEPRVLVGLKVAFRWSWQADRAVRAARPGPNWRGHWKLMEILTRGTQKFDVELLDFPRHLLT